ncbi:PC-Esterase [Dillenia turbinata]|uniref:PC-Esterase n=1 Tax=Dillenia turbinata TaxID=194707 RepID=A0AAN8ZDW1_9MAGN
MADQTRTNIGGGSQTHVKYEETDVCRRLNKKNTQFDSLAGNLSREYLQGKSSKQRYGSPDMIKQYNINTPNLGKLIRIKHQSPTHLWNNFKQALNHRNWEWKPGGDRNCFNNLILGNGLEPKNNRHSKDVLQQLKINITFLNITQLSVNRKDGHTTVYTKRNGELLTKEKADPKNFADCIHWCLPGIPDAWNEIMYAYLLHDYAHSWAVRRVNKKSFKLL